ncbi:MAG: undecaprenyl-diphosphatase, partial [Planctomycetota bacterium]
CIQVGAILAVLGLYRARVVQVLRGFMGRDTAGLRLGIALIVAFIPAAIVGLLFDEGIEEVLFGMKPIIAAWFVGGVAILVTSRFRRAKGTSEGKELMDLSIGAALIIGLCQCLALWPGTSRSLVTIVGGLAVGLTMASAVEFSFLLGVITLCAATAYKSLKAGPEMLESYGAIPLLLGTLSAWVFALISVKWMVRWLQSHGLSIFGWYRVILALSVGVWLFG